METLSLLVAFAGGIFGAAIGGLAAFVFVGILILVGVAAQATGADLLSVPLGAAFGPHVGGFASGVAAAAYAAKKGVLEGGGKDIVSPMMGLNKPDVLLIGGIFGIVGYLLNYCFTLVNFPWTDTIALSVVVSGIIVRVLWGNGVFGHVAEGSSRYEPTPGTEWVPWQSSIGQRLIIGLGAGALSAYLTTAIGVDNGGVVFGFAISAASLAFLFFGLQVPVTHHITLIAAVVTASSGSILMGTIFAMIAAVLGEFFADTFHVHGDTHIDPPACTIAAVTSLSLICGNLGLYKIPMPF
ncbi:hypothetical protein [Maridesulfovibrio sp.]|uniref:hypothetical protein n=1 Tax=Maridesulfovibrio sp. TaxID=2795000 RepID=UPI003BA9F9FA